MSSAKAWAEAVDTLVVQEVHILFLAHHLFLIFLVATFLFLLVECVPCSGLGEAGQT